MLISIIKTIHYTYEIDDEKDMKGVCLLCLLLFIIF